uniref:Bidirectional sugar transporter SWEET n=1 Tax=Physcomitrium patens TaxID=3218 RepID=A0A2K1JT68_PHYPA|nr:hypothetical protein PHYPA_014501 [Physcomitrium patens]
MCEHARGRPTFWRIVKSRKVDDFSGMPYLTAALNTCLWTLYGLPFVSFQVLVVTVNAAGAGLEISYIIIYLMYSEGKARMRVVKFFAVMVCGFILMTGLVLGLVDSVDTRKTILGVMGAFLGSLMYAAPLTVMRMVIQTKSVEFMPFLLSLFVFLNSTTWTIYAGVPETDLYILIPNGLGLLLGTTQLVLYAMYRGSTPRKPSLPTFSYKLAVETPPKFAPAPDSKANRPLGPGNQKILRIHRVAKASAGYPVSEKGEDVFKGRSCAAEQQQSDSLVTNSGSLPADSVSIHTARSRSDLCGASPSTGTVASVPDLCRRHRFRLLPGLHLHESLCFFYAPAGADNSNSVLDSMPTIS